MEADVVKVVRCKNCIYFKDSDESEACHCDLHEISTHLLGYCSCGEERKMKDGSEEI